MRSLRSRQHATAERDRAIADALDRMITDSLAASDGDDDQADEDEQPGTGRRSGTGWHNRRRPGRGRGRADTGARGEQGRPMRLGGSVLVQDIGNDVSRA